MNSYQRMIESITETFLKKELPYKNTIMIGENASGKSQILKMVMEQCNKNEYYFIDSVNRSFNVNEASLKEIDKIKLGYSEKINENRIREENYNLKDTFFWNGQATNHIGEIYPYFAESLNRLLKKFWNIELSIKQEIFKTSYINEEEMALSNGYQAVIRILLELLFFDTYTKEIKDRTVIIDEIDEYLHPKTNAAFFQFLVNTFPNIRFLVTTHSADLVASIDNCNLIVLSGDTWERLDSGDYNSVSYANSLFNIKSYIDNQLTPKEKNDVLIRNLLNNKMSGVWKAEDKEMLDELKNGELTLTQKLMLKQIEG